jgi:hypothetical protein
VQASVADAPVLGAGLHLPDLLGAPSYHESGPLTNR